jgi:addiction module HigA family antidote
MPTKDPPHPGRIVRQESLEATVLSVTDAAKALDVSRNAMSELVNEQRGISPEMAAGHRKSGRACNSITTWRRS